MKNTAPFTAKNEVVAVGGALRVDVSTPKCRFAYMLIDPADLHYVWSVNGGSRITAILCGPANKCLYASTRTIGGKQTYIHRLICPSGDHVDHINGNGLDNRRSNLRPVTASQNHMNRRVKSTSSTGIKGVRKTQWGSYKASICANGNRVHLGTFKTIEEAIQARKQAEQKYFGEYAGAGTSRENSNG